MLPDVVASGDHGPVETKGLKFRLTLTDNEQRVTIGTCET